MLNSPAKSAEEADGVIGGVCPEEGCAILDQEITKKVVGSFPGPAGGVVPVDVVVDHGGAQGGRISGREDDPPEDPGDACSVALEACGDGQIPVGQGFKEGVDVPLFV